MTIESSTKNRAISATLILGVFVGSSLLRPSSSAAIPVPPTFVATLVQALPAIGSVVSKLFNPADKKAVKPTPTQQTAIDALKKESEDGKKQLAGYAKREQVIWRIVTASSQTSRAVSVMISEASDKSDLTESEIADLSSDLKFVNAGVKSVVDSKPDLTLFGSDALQLSAISDLISNAPPLVENITDDLKYSPTKKNPELVKLLHKHLQELDGIFRALDKATAAEIKMIADGLSAVSAPAQPAPTDKNAIQAAAEKDANSAFGNLGALDFQISLANHDFKEALQKFEKKEEKF